MQNKVCCLCHSRYFEDLGDGKEIFNQIVLFWYISANTHKSLGYHSVQLDVCSFYLLRLDSRTISCSKRLKKMYLATMITNSLILSLSVSCALSVSLCLHWAEIKLDNTKQNIGVVKYIYILGFYIRFRFKSWFLLFTASLTWTFALSEPLVRHKY